MSELKRGRTKAADGAEKGRAGNMDVTSDSADSGMVRLQSANFHNSDNTGQFVNPSFVVEVSNGPPPPYNGTPVADQTNGNAQSLPNPEASTRVRMRMSSGGSSNSNVNKKTSIESQRSSVSEGKFEDSFTDESGLSLIYSRHERVPFKDFTNEVRATMDVQKFLNNTVLLLDIHHSNLDVIVDDILKKMLGTDSPISSDQAKSALFTTDCVHQLSRTIQSSVKIDDGGGFDYDQNWVCAMCSIPSITKGYVGIARLATPANFGMTCQEVYFVIVILTPTKEKGTKSELETGRTFATMFSDIDFRLELMGAPDEEHFKGILQKETHKLSEKQKLSETKMAVFDSEEEKPKMRCGFLRGIKDDLKRRLPHYFSDYKDGVADKKSILKTLSTTLFLYFACILPCIAFGVLNSDNTHQILTVEKVLYSQMFGGMLFAVFGGTPQIVLLTTAPLALFTKIIYSICEDFSLPFQPMFCCVGLWNAFFLVVFSVFDLSILMQFSTRSSEEIFALFISIAFAVDAFKNCAGNFEDYYSVPACYASSSNSDNSTLLNITTAATTTVTSVTTTVADNMSTTLSDLAQHAPEEVCRRDISMLYLVLLFGTVWIGVTLFNFKNTPYLTLGKREILADYSLPVAVIIMAFFGAYVFRDVNMGFSFNSESEPGIFKLVEMNELTVGAIFGAMGLGFCLSLLFFMDQNISAALVNAPQNKMKKGTAYHWDLLVIAAVNAALSLVCFPWVHAALPHSPLHVLALADVEERVEQGHISRIIVRVRETRLTAIFSHILIGLSLLFMPVLAYIPTPVLYGLFLYVAVTALYGNQMFERILLFFTEQAAYPPYHYIRRVPQRKMHIFTLTQLFQLAVLCGFGFSTWPYLKMFFPVLIFFLIPIRHKIIPKLIDSKYLNAMDSH
ncbi:solute carrier family 4 member 11-like isoform X1 [Haliotis cracherodii]|uniref:solute carrier family 4 member 11-like isoform X1 n=1 Tax=Haliotis cracherodii TaxID=6455 RepID=UPI0039EA9698